MYLRQKGGLHAIGALLLLLICTSPLLAAPDFPKLSGRVVDEANLLDRAAEARLTARLAAYEEAGGNQVVVVTVPNLGGYSIEEYGYQLGRHWGIGQKGEDNGVLLIVAQDERQVRIEVGYGLEGELTDALAANIIHAVILPRFRSGDYSAGIEEGAMAVMDALGGSYAMQERPRADHDRAPPWVYLLFFAGWFSSVHCWGGVGVEPSCLVALAPAWAVVVDGEEAALVVEAADLAVAVPREAGK